MLYQVGVSNANVTASLGPALVEANNTEHAKEVFAANENTTIETLAAGGLAWWSVSPEPTT